jgi:hypothetical protein
MTDSPDDVIDVALRVAGALESVGATYFVGGSLASSLHGEPRATNDIDFVIDMAIGRAGALAAALGEDFEVDVDMLRDAVMHGRCANVFYLPLAMKIDFFGHAHGAFDDAEFLRRRPILVREGRALVMKSAEDTILRKLLWFREGGEVSERQWRDVLGVLRAQQGNLDDAYLQEWARRLGIADLLERARAACA